VSRAQAMVEVALVIPLLVIGSVAIVQFSFWLHAETTINTAVAEAARTAAARGGSTEAGNAVGLSILHDELGSNASLVTLVPSQSATQVRFEATGSLPLYLFASTQLPLHASATMTKERFVP
jgi:Flp pilus assembly protein TadG